MVGESHCLSVHWPRAKWKALDDIMEKVKLPEKIWAWNNVMGKTMTTLKWIGPVPNHVVTYVPASEAEALRERVKQLEGALKYINSLAPMSPNAPTMGDYEHLQEAAREALGGGEEKKS